VVRRGTQQDFAFRRKARLRRIWRTTSRSSLVTSLPKQSSPLLSKSRAWKKLVSVLQSHQEDSDDSSLSSVEGDTHFQYACAAIANTHLEVAMALKSHKAQDLDLRSMWLLDNQSSFDLCCNPNFSHKRRATKRAMHMSSNGSGLRISKECKVLGLLDINRWLMLI
jgi:hypothetical protein